MKVLHVISTLDPAAGGPVNAIEGLTSALVQQGIHVEILAPYRSGEDPSVADRLKQRGITLTRIGPVRTPIGYHPQLKTAVHQAVARSDIVHIHALWEDVQHHAARAAQAQNKPYIIRPCGMLDPWSLKQSPIRKKIYLALRLRRNLNRASVLHFTAQPERDLTAPLKLKAPAIIEPNGLDLSEFEHLPPPGTFRDAHPELGNQPYVLFLSRIHPKKGLDLLIPAFAQAAPPEYALVIAGPGEPDYIASIKVLVKQHGLTDRVLFPGMLTGQTKLAAYAEAELFALPSYQENFGIVIIESLACGVPALVSKRVNIVDELEGARVVHSTKPTLAALTETVAQYFDGTSIRLKPSSDIRRYALEKYDWDEIARRWLGIYQVTDSNS